MEKIPITVVGAGVIGLACARELSGRCRNIVVIEKEDSFGRHTSSRNSEVIHAGLYYEPRSLKCTTCIEGKNLLYALCRQHSIPYIQCGKLIVAHDSSQEKEILSIYENARACGVTSLSIITPGEIEALEPSIAARKAVFSPESGILDSHRLMSFLYLSAKENGVTFSFSTEVTGISRIASGYRIQVREPSGEIFEFVSECVINAAGIFSDRIAQMAGIDIDKCGYRQHFCKGQYFRVRNPARFGISRLVYPPATGISLGIHITPDIAGGLRLGPDAHYTDFLDYTVDARQETAFYTAVRPFLPSLTPDDIIPDTAGIRPKLQTEDEDLKDFIIKEEQDRGLAGFINCIGIESPGLTACLSIARRVVKAMKIS